MLTHPRISVSAMSSVRWTFDEDLALWRDGWSLYLTPGRPTGEPWEELLERLAEAAAPSVAYARGRGVRLAFEPAWRTEVSFVPGRCWPPPDCSGETTRRSDKEEPDGPDEQGTRHAR